MSKEENRASTGAQPAKKRRTEQEYEVISGDAGPSVSSSQCTAPAVSTSGTPETTDQQEAASTSRAPKKLQKRNEKGESALHMAAKKNEIQQAKKLIKAGLDVNAQDNAGWTPLHESVIRDFLPLSKLLLTRGANPNLQGMHGETALHDAASNGFERMCRLLRAHGADPNQLNESGISPISVAKNQRIVDILQASSADLSEDTMSSCSSSVSFSAVSEADTNPPGEAPQQPGSSTSVRPAEPLPSSSSAQDCSQSQSVQQAPESSSSRRKSPERSPPQAEAVSSSSAVCRPDEAAKVEARPESDVEDFQVSSSSPTPAKSKFFHRGSSSAGSSSATASTNLVAAGEAAASVNKDPYAFDEDEETMDKSPMPSARPGSTPPSGCSSGLPLKLRISEQWKNLEQQQNPAPAPPAPPAEESQDSALMTLPKPEFSQPGSSSSDEDLMKVPPLRIKIPQESSYEMASASGSTGKPPRTTRASLRTKEDGGAVDDSCTPPPAVEVSCTPPPSVSAAPPPKKRKLRPRAEEVAAAAAQLAAQPLPDPAAYKQIKIPENPIDRLAAVKRQLKNRLNRLSVVQPKAPKGYAEFKLMTKRYLLADNKYAVELPKTLPPPSDLEFEALKELFLRQEEARQGLRLSQQAERERLVLAAEQEMIRAHTRSALALASQPRQLSFCAAIAEKDFTHLPADFEDASGGVRDRFSGRQFLAWVDDIEHKFAQAQRSLAHRQLNEADALMAVQKMDWEMRFKELRPDERWSPNLWLRIPRHHVPLVDVPLQFELFKTRPV